MHWYYLIGEKSVGPIENDELLRLAAAGTITDVSLVWNETFTEWQPWALVRNQAPVSWYFLEQQQTRGPITETTLREMVAAKSISRATLVWHAKLGDWQPLGNVISAEIGSTLTTTEAMTSISIEENIIQPATGALSVDNVQVRANSMSHMIKTPTIGIATLVADRKFIGLLIVIATLIGVNIVLLLWSTPQHVRAYNETGLALPKLTQSVIIASDYLLNYWYIGTVLVLAMIAIIGFLRIKKPLIAERAAVGVATLLLMVVPVIYWCLHQTQDVPAMVVQTEIAPHPLVLLQSEQLATAEKYLGNGIDPNWRDSNGESLLYRAIQKGDQSLVRLLLARGADPNGYCNTSGRVPVLHGAVEVCIVGGRSDIIGELLGKGASATAYSDNGMNALMVAIWNRGHFDEPLEMGQEEMLATLIAAGASVNDRARSGWREVVGFDPDPDDALGWTPLFFAANAEAFHIINFLLDHGADPTMKDAWGKYPYDWVNNVQHTEAVFLRQVTPGVDVFSFQNPQQVKPWQRPQQKVQVQRQQSVPERIAAARKLIEERYIKRWMYIAEIKGKAVRDNNPEANMICTKLMNQVQEVRDRYQTQLLKLEQSISTSVTAGNASISLDQAGEVDLQKMEVPLTAYQPVTKESYRQELADIQKEVEADLQWAWQTVSG